MDPRVWGSRCGWLGRRRVPRLGTSGAAAALAVTAALASPLLGRAVGPGASGAERSALGPPCLFHHLTGLSCPGCGATRAFLHLVRGDLTAAIGSNPLLVVAALLLLWAKVEPRLAASRRVARRPFLQHPLAGWGLVGLTVLFAVARNLPFPAFRWLAP